MSFMHTTWMKSTWPEMFVVLRLQADLVLSLWEQRYLAEVAMFHK